LKKVAQEARVMVFYEAPRRIVSMLKDILDIFGNRQLILLRELTKVYEEIIRGPVNFILEELKSVNIRGEFTVIVEGAKEDIKNHCQDLDLQKEIRALLNEGNLGVRSIATLLSETHGLDYRKTYKKVLALKNKTGNKSIVKSL